VEPRERRLLATIEKLMRTKVRIEPVPTVTDVRHLRLRRTQDAVQALLDDPEAQLRLDTYRETLDEMLLDRDPMDVALAAFVLAHEATQGATTDDDDRDLTAALPSGDDGARRKPGKKPHGDSTSDGPTRKRPRLEGPTTRLFISVGRKAGVTPSDLVGAITGEAGLKGRDIGAITVHESFSLVEVPEDKARKTAKAMNHCTIRGRKASVRLDRG
jgi:ATP-dependent RNA helicase DeaD